MSFLYSKKIGICFLLRHNRLFFKKNFGGSNPAEIKVSSNYGYSQFGNMNVTNSDNSTYGMSNLPFSEEKLIQKTYLFKVPKSLRLLKILILMLVS